ncbi:MAG: LysE family transporter [Phototrophicaceae bacterium]
MTVQKLTYWISDNNETILLRNPIGNLVGCNTKRYPNLSYYGNIERMVGMFQSIILPAMSLGLSATSVPGPLQAYLLNVSLKYGWRRGLLVILAPLIVDIPIIFITVFVLQQVPEWAIQVIRVSGGLLLLWIAWNAWQQLRSGVQFTSDQSEKIKIEVSPLKILGTAIAMTFLSPGPYLFWSTVTGPLLIEALDISLWAAGGMLLGFYGTFLGGMAILVFIFNRLGKIDATITRYILVATIGLLVWFATQLIVADVLGLLIVYQIITAIIVVSVIGYLGISWRDEQRNKHSIIS